MSGETGIESGQPLEPISRARIESRNGSRLAELIEEYVRASKAENTLRGSRAIGTISADGARRTTFTPCRPTLTPLRPTSPNARAI